MGKSTKAKTVRIVSAPSSPLRGTSEEEYSDRLLKRWENVEMITGMMRPDKKRFIDQLTREFPQAKRIVIDEGFEMLSIKNYKSMKGVPTRNLKLRHSMAKYLLRLVVENQRRMEHYWYAYSLEWIMSEYLETELQRIMKKLEGK